MIVLGLVVLAGLYSYAKSARHAGFQGCLTLYVADVSSPSLISAPSTTLDTAGQLLAGETAANFFADDILDVGQSSKVAGFISAKIAPLHLPNTGVADINGAVSGSRRDRTVNLCVSNPNSQSALSAAQALGVAMTTQRVRFIGKAMAHRTFVTVVSSAGATPATTSHHLIDLALRLFLGLLVALGLALLWDVLDPRVRDDADIERVLGAPVLATLR